MNNSHYTLHSSDVKEFNVFIEFCLAYKLDSAEKIDYEYYVFFEYF